MKCWVIIYHHRFGTDAWPVFSARRPTAKSVIKTLGDWEERDDEWIEIRGPWELP
jgi:hypothetical protein